MGISSLLLAQKNDYAYLSTNGNLVMVPDNDGNVIPDYSNVGYKLRNEPIPNIGVEITLNPSNNPTKDRTTDIQNAINTLSNRPIKANGFRGAILFKKGTYTLKNTLKINASGIVLRGEGDGNNGTIIHYDKREKSNAIEIHGTRNAIGITSSRKQVTDNYVHIGQNTFTVASRHSFTEGDEVFYIDQKTDAWASAIKMDNLSSDCASHGDPARRDWTKEDYTLNYKRKVVQVNGNKITLDAPAMEFSDGIHSKAFIEKYTWNDKIEHIGIENLKMTSFFAHGTDENHGWNALDVNAVENMWIRNVHIQYFGGLVIDLKNAYKITIRDSKISDYKSKVTGGRRYGYHVSTNTQRAFVFNCTSENGGRHDYVTGSRALGPNVYLDCSATNVASNNGQFSDSGPHHRWATGILWENIVSTGSINIENRGCAGTGHGYAGTQHTFWNCIAKSMIAHSPQLAYKNWIIGCSTSDGISVTKRRFGARRGTPGAEIDAENNARAFSLFREQDKSRGISSNPSDNCQFRKLDGRARDIGSGGGKTYIVGNNRRVYERRNNNWKILPDGGFEADKLDVNSNGAVWVIDTYKKIHLFKNNTWFTINGRATDVGAGNNSVYIIGENDIIFKRQNQSWKAQNNAVKAKRVDVSGSGFPWIVGSDDYVYQLVNGKWFRKGNFKAQDLSFAEGDNNLWALSLNNGKVNFYEGNKKWKTQSGSGEQISVGTANEVWVVNNKKEIFVGNCLNSSDNKEDLTELTLTKEIEAYPNPTNGLVTFSNIYNTYNVEVSNIQGIKIISKIVDKDKITIDLSSIANGMYLLHLKQVDNNNKPTNKYVFKLVKE